MSVGLIESPGIAGKLFCYQFQYFQHYKTNNLRSWLRCCYIETDTLSHNHSFEKNIKSIDEYVHSGEGK